MPTYDHDCPRCGGFEAFRALAQRNEPARCPACGTDSPRVFATAPRLACLDAGTRTAMDANERARHAPMSAQAYGEYRRLKAHPSGCGCCATGPGSRKATVTAPNGNKTFPGKRPWMISH